MTRKYINTHFLVPMEVLEEYEKWERRHKNILPSEEWDYTDGDLQQLSQMLSLRDVGFSANEIKSYMNLILDGEASIPKRLRMLNEQRKKTLDEIHILEKQIEKINCLTDEA